MSNNYREIAKPLADRMVELVRALQLIQDSLTHLQAGHVRHLATLSGQLRALLTDRSSKPLLLDIAKVLSRDLIVYCMPGVDDPDFPKELRDGIVLHVAGFPVTLHKQFTKQIQLSLSDLTSQKIVSHKSRLYSVEQVIEWYANKAGGAHYATVVPEDFSTLLSDTPYASEALSNLLFQLGQVTLESGRQLVKILVDSEIHAVVAIPPQAESNILDENFLFDSQYNNSMMRVCILVNKRLMPSFYVRGLQGLAARVDADRLIDWSEPRYLHASLYIDSDLSTVLDLAVDGERVGRTRIHEPLFVISDPLDYESYQNKSADGGPQNFSFAMGSLAIFNRELDHVSSAKAAQHFSESRTDPSLRAILFHPLAFGHAKKGTKDHQITGQATMELARDLLAKSS